MRKFVFVFLALLATLTVYGQTNNGMLDGAISNAVQKIQDEITNGQTIIVYQFNSHSSRLSDYILKELFDDLVNSHKFTVLDRTAQEVVNAELDFQFNKSAGMISDESLASLTKRIGAQAILTGSLDDAVNEYRFRVRVIGTETTAVILSFTENINKDDKRITAFEGRKSTSQKILTGTFNIALGLGSYLEGDIIGGATLTAGYAVAAGLVIFDAVALDWDSPAVGIPATIGVATAGLSIAYGFARPFIYNRVPHMVDILDNAKASIVMVSDAAGNRKVSFQTAYTIKF
jgi:TolB-like protein